MEQLTNTERDVGHQQHPRLLNINLFLLFQGQLVSNMGTHVYNIAMILWIKEATGLAWLMGLLLIFSLLPNIVIGPLAGVVVDRWSRKKVIVLSDLICGVAVLCVAALLFLIPRNTPLILGRCSPPQLS
jgi:MFS family permease